MHVNVDKLKEIIKQSGYDMYQIAQAIGINRATLYRKMDANGVKFTIGEIQKLIEVLGLSDEEAIEIFFSKEVA